MPNWSGGDTLTSVTYISLERLDAAERDAGKLLAAEASYLRDVIREELRRNGIRDSNLPGKLRLELTIELPDQVSA